jgi:hypothetical protein
MSTYGTQPTAEPVAISAITSGATEEEANQLVVQIAAQDAEIARLEEMVRDLPQLLTSLAGHPVLWLLLGREGVDRPGVELGSLVGQQVVIERRSDWRFMVLVGLVMLALGVGLSIGLVWFW